MSPQKDDIHGSRTLPRLPRLLKEDNEGLYLPPGIEELGMISHKKSLITIFGHNSQA